MPRNDEIRHAIRPPSLLAAAALALAGLGSWPIPASAQPNSTLGHSSPWDLTIAAGALAARPALESSDRYRDEWYDTGQLALVVGRHLTPHFKVELEASTAAEGHQFVERYVTVPNAGYPVPYATERFTTLRQVSGSVIWQFFENEWAHPFVQAGVAADVERVRSFTPAQTFYTGDPRLPGSRVEIAEERRDGPDTTTTAGLVLGGGAKLYATPRVFVRTDGRLTANRGGRHVAFRLGVGVDF